MPVLGSYPFLVGGKPCHRTGLGPSASRVGSGCLCVRGAGTPPILPNSPGPSSILADCPGPPPWAPQEGQGGLAKYSAEVGAGDASGIPSPQDRGGA